MVEERSRDTLSSGFLHSSGRFYLTCRFVVGAADLRLDCSSYIPARDDGYNALLRMPSPRLVVLWQTREWHPCSELLKRMSYARSWVSPFLREAYM